VDFPVARKFAPVPEKSPEIPENAPPWFNLGGWTKEPGAQKLACGPLPAGACRRLT
jgi:hypothetical protein